MLNSITLFGLRVAHHYLNPSYSTLADSNLLACNACKLRLPLSRLLQRSGQFPGIAPDALHKSGYV